MKILQIFGLVVAVHVIAFIVIFASPGCQSGPRVMPTPDATLPANAPAATTAYDAGAANPQSVDLGTPVVTYTPESTPGYAAPTRPGSPAAAAVVPTRNTVEVAPVSTYTVARGDSLWSIAKKNHLTVAELAKANKLSTGAMLQPGKKLMIPGKVAPKDLGTPMLTVKNGAESMDKAEAPASHPGAEAVKHTVTAGETLGAIARKYQVTVGELAAANNITDPSKVRAGQQLVIPGFKAVGSKGGTTKAVVKPAAPKPAVETATTPPPAPHFDITPPPPGQDLDSGLKDATTEVPTIKVETPPADQPPQK